MAPGFFIYAYVTEQRREPARESGESVKVDVD